MNGCRSGAQFFKVSKWCKFCLAWRKTASQAFDRSIYATIVRRRCLRLRRVGAACPRITDIAERVVRRLHFHLCARSRKPACRAHQRLLHPFFRRLRSRWQRSGDLRLDSQHVLDDSDWRTFIHHRRHAGTAGFLRRATRLFSGWRAELGPNGLSQFTNDFSIGFANVGFEPPLPATSFTYTTESTEFFWETGNVQGSLESGAQVVPEPSTLLLLGGGSIAVFRRSRKS